MVLRNVKFLHWQVQSSRNELIAFVNKHVPGSAETIEDLASAIAYCKMINQLQKGLIDMKKVHMKKVKNEKERERNWFSNWQMLQRTFQNHKIYAPIDHIVEGAARQGAKENLYFLQWFKVFYEENKKSPKK